MNPSTAADSPLLTTIKQQLKIAINDMRWKNGTGIIARLLSGQGIDARITTEDYSFKREQLEETFTVFLDIPTVITDEDSLYYKLHQFEKKVLKYFLVFSKARLMLEDPLEQFYSNHEDGDLLDSETCFNMDKVDGIFDEFEKDIINEYSWQIEECLKEERNEEDNDEPQRKKLKM